MGKPQKEIRPRWWNFLRLALQFTASIAGLSCVALIVTSAIVGPIHICPRVGPWRIVDERFRITVSANQLRMGQVRRAARGIQPYSESTRFPFVFEYVRSVNDQCAGPPIKPTTPLYNQWLLRLNLWIPVVLLLAVPAVMFVRAMMRCLMFAKPGTCYRCGYDLTGNESGRCPECGNSIGDADHESASK